MGDAAETSGWHLRITEHFVFGTGSARHTRYRAQSMNQLEAPKEVLFRFSEVERLYQALVHMPDLRDISLPRLPPKVTFHSVLHGRFDVEFVAERQLLLQAFFDELSAGLNAKYAVVGDTTELCEPLAHFIGQGAQAVLTEEQAAGAAQRLEEDRQLIAVQNREYEESLQADELRKIAQAEQAERDEREAREHAERTEAAAAAAAAAVEVLQKRRDTFEEDNPVPGEAEPKAIVRFRAANGSTVHRSFRDDAKVAVLFEFAAIAEWDGPTRAFDLRTSFPVRSLRGSEQQTLKEAGLCPSAALLLAEDEDSA
eukprot:CAMPEP_0171087800 /NCGR_PEP_ID=MMETSP0766_2-20121228/20379_1 /TAXON_ID=439317 /ORGANISM="Gambierdiscus australes, Strain CAWD 149" /LENGTH=311 /DNA_ID=CAMNT_0011545531 /DNA_START=43 /DNA_END=978 /DNA_ORIENTATION=+